MITQASLSEVVDALTFRNKSQHWLIRSPVEDDGPVAPQTLPRAITGYLRRPSSGRGRLLRRRTAPEETEPVGPTAGLRGVALARHVTYTRGARGLRRAAVADFVITVCSRV